MCEVKDHQDYTKAAEREAGMGNGNGRKLKILDEASMLTKIVVAVVSLVIVGVLVFGVRVYSFMDAGPRFSSEDYLLNENVQDAMIHRQYVSQDVYESDRKYIRDTLRRIEKKLDDAVDPRR